MAPTRYSLHYEDYSEHLMSRFGKLLQMQSLVDMTLMCSSHTLRVHKAVLAASSAYFQEVLQKQSGEPLIILKIRFSVLKSLVEFMYCGKTQCLEENLDELVSAAQFLKIKGLSKVTKEGLGIDNSNELPAFPPPVVINRPPQSLIDLHCQDSTDSRSSAGSQLVPGTSSSQPMDCVNRSSKDMVVKIPIDIENGNSGSMDYTDKPPSVKPRRGRPSVRQQRASVWNNPCGSQLNRAAERELLKREQDSRKAISQLRSLQTQQINEYMDRVSLSHAVSSICEPESSGVSGAGGGYLGVDAELLYMENVLDPQPPLNSTMSQYVTALKNAGLPTDLPILFESGDGSYINVNEEVLLDMVQSTEIQYEVIEQPNIIEKVADPADIKSIDDLSKSIERGEILMNTKNYTSTGYEKDQFRHEDAINTLNSILPDNLESFGDQQNYVVLDPRLQEGNGSIDSGNDFSCIDGDMQFFTKSMSDDVKKFYEGHQLDCPTSTSLEANFNISMLDKDTANLEPQYNLNGEDLRRNDDCYDFDMQLAQTADFKGDALDCLIATPRRLDDGDNPDSSAKAREEIIKDLMNFENKINMSSNQTSILHTDTSVKCDVGNGDFINPLSVPEVFDRHHSEAEVVQSLKDTPVDLSGAIGSNDIQWTVDSVDSIDNKENDAATFEELNKEVNNVPEVVADSQYKQSTPVTLEEAIKIKTEGWDDIDNSSILNSNQTNDNKDIPSTLQEDIPFAVGLLPLKQIQPNEENSLLKRRSSTELDLMDNVDAQCLKRKVKLKKT